MRFGGEGRIKGEGGVGKRKGWENWEKGGDVKKRGGR